jgi:SAM-dependent methyltransferase
MICALPNLDEPSLNEVPLTALCRVEHFVLLARWLECAIPFARERFGAEYPRGVEYRKHWEVAQALRALAHGGGIRKDAQVLGIGAGNEPTIFVLTNYVQRVFATDLYLANGWTESANIGMLTKPGATWSGQWEPRRLVVQHMNALDLRFEDGTFDGAFSSSSIEHFGTFEDVAASLRECFRVLKPGATYALSTEFRLAGPPPGLPGILMFDWDELQHVVFGSAPWEVVGPVQISGDQRALDPVVSFDAAARAVQSHVAKYGEIHWDRLNWPEYPHVRLRHGDLIWTSVSLALRKPG